MLNYYDRNQMGTVVTDKSWRNLDKTDIQKLCLNVFVCNEPNSHIF